MAEIYIKGKFLPAAFQCAIALHVWKYSRRPPERASIPGAFSLMDWVSTVSTGAEHKRIT